jgi:anti-sigma factor RsiW
MTHLTEEQRHGVADGSLEPADLTAAESHLQACPDCSADIERIRRLMKRVDDSKAQAVASVDELWPGIRERIEERKVVALPTDVTQSEARGKVLPKRWMLVVGAVAAAGIIGLWLVRDASAPGEPTSVVQTTDSGVSLIALVDSTHAYQEEAQALLNRLELQRATMRPELARAVERDLRVIDVAIAELQDAIRNDPANPALRRLLASSYRQKVDLLKRVSNAG